MSRKYIKVFENFQSDSDEERYLMYVPKDGSYTMTAAAHSKEELLEEDELHSAEEPIRIWYQFDLDGFTLINKRIVKGPPNDPEYYENPHFEFDVPDSIEGYEETEPAKADWEAPDDEEKEWFSNDGEVDLRSE